MAPELRICPAPADFDDWPGLLALLRQAFAYMDGRIDPPSSLHRLDAPALREKARSETLLLAFAGPQLIGCAFAALRPNVVYVGKLAVAQTARGQGVARRLMDEAEALARRHGRSALELETRVELTENHRSFEALGFREVGRSAHPGYTRPTSITMRRAID